MKYKTQELFEMQQNRDKPQSQSRDSAYIDYCFASLIVTVRWTGPSINIHDL
jgi:hypothetical protein